MKTRNFRIHESCDRCALYQGVLIITLILAACSGGGTGSPEKGAASSGTITFRINWDGAPVLPEDNMISRAAERDICEDYQIESVRITLFDSGLNKVAQKTVDCAQHQATLTKVPPGSDFRLMIEGVVADRIDWRGEFTGVKVMAGKNSDLGAVSVRYIGDDDTPPFVRLSTPTKDAANIGPNSKIEVLFSEPVVAATVNADSFIVRKGETPVPGQVRYHSQSNTATFSPDAEFQSSTTYGVTLTTDIEDLAGNKMSAPYSFDFTTGTVKDITAPTVDSTIPKSDATGVDTNTSVSVTFSEPMDPGTITTTAFSISSAHEAVTCTLIYRPVYHDAICIPMASLAATTSYTATVTTDVKDLSGNPLAKKYTWTFTTGKSGVPGLVWDERQWDEASWQ